MGIVPKFQAIDKYCKTLKIIRELETDLPYYELEKIKLSNGKLYIEIFMEYTVPGESEYYLEMNLDDYSYTLPDFDRSSSLNSQDTGGNEAYQDL